MPKATPKGYTLARIALKSSTVKAFKKKHGDGWHEAVQSLMSNALDAEKAPATIGETLRALKPKTKKK